ncbi:hypothetical protein DEO72_LG7g812 [Vigna unguiculata]|uniref:Uncharacterized protein n=1 Tax=Vigna unguiculata TaxID=3917 RepID=A0A4D6MDN1_VIGUN|nr:hypothetical protein DEO72_LG7g812 [Vigna unguiculata]
MATVWLPDHDQNFTWRRGSYGRWCRSASRERGHRRWQGLQRCPVLPPMTQVRHNAGT